MPEVIGSVETVERVRPQENENTKTARDILSGQGCSQCKKLQRRDDETVIDMDRCPYPDKKYDEILPYRKYKSRVRCWKTCWSTWLKFSSVLYLVLFVLIILWILRQKSLEKVDKNQVQTILPSAQKGLLDQHAVNPKALVQYQRGQPKQDSQRIEWLSNTSDSYIIGGISYSDRQLIVPEDGYYQIQCRVQFDTFYITSVPKKDNLIHFTMSRARPSEMQYINLMEEKFTLRPKELRGVQLGPTTFELKKGDGIYVTVNHPHLVFPTEKNYFEVRKIE